MFQRTDGHKTMSGNKIRPFATRPGLPLRDHDFRLSLEVTTLFDENNVALD